MKLEEEVVEYLLRQQPRVVLFSARAFWSELKEDRTNQSIITVTE